MAQGVWKVGKYAATAAAAFCGTRTPVSPVDRQPGSRAAKKWIAKTESDLYFAGGHLGTFPAKRSEGQRHLAQSRLRIAAVYRRGQPRRWWRSMSP
ncbi:hypothetical protein KCP73_20680 [Salmonella enterica subsp. enterica]|nr:hypothetical protein KCP73_20680 [Salmonella enterica subsp. enterica]